MLSPHVPVAPAFAALCGALVASAPVAMAAQTAKRTFDLPRGDAALTLKQFAGAGLPIVYLVDRVRGATTNAVRGEFTPREALERMLAGSGLVATQDAATGAFVVSPERRAGPPARSGEVGPVSDPQPEPKRTVKHPRRTLIAAVVGWLVASTPLDAQTRTGPSAPDTPQDEAVVLSPFFVNTGRDTGFVAASSLAGGRLAGDLRDTPVAYSVITKDFIEALGITDAFEAANWSPNTVIAVGSGGFGEDNSNNPGSYRVRGAGGGRGQRNFFLYNSPNDAYAVERFDFGRGPNAVLFGNGSLGGVATTMTKQARFDSDFTHVSHSYGSWNFHRSTLDTNRRIGDRAAVRFAGVYSDSDGWRDKQFNKIRALFLTTSYRIGRNTTVRLEGEYGEVERNQTFSNLTDRLSGWDGKTTFSGSLATLPANANAIGVTRRGPRYLVYDPLSGVNAIMNYQNDPTTMGGGENGQVPLAGVLQTFAPFYVAGHNLLYQFNVPASRFDNAIAGSAFRLPPTSFSLASDTPVIQERFKDVQVTVDHRIGDLYMQFAADLNRTRQFINQIDVRNSNVMYIDINRVLPNGANNPHFLQPYADGLLRRNFHYRHAQAARFAAGYRKGAGQWGTYTFNVMGGYSEDRSMTDAQNLSVAQNPDHRRWGSTGATLPLTDVVRARRYWNEPSRPLLSPAEVRYIDPITGVDKMVNPLWVLENDRSDSQQLTKSVYGYGIAALNAKYFRNRLVVLGAARMDGFYNNVRQQVLVGDYPLDWNGKEVQFKPAPPADWASLKYTPKDANGNALGPAVSADTRPRDGNGNRREQYANDRFKDDYNAPAIQERKTTVSIGTVLHVTPWLSPYINYAETFNPPAAIQRIDSSFLNATVAKGVDIGLRASLFERRLNLTAIRYTNKEINSAVDPFIAGTINSLLAANPLGDLSVAGRNKRDVPNVPAVLRDTQDRLAEGLEFEAVANLGRLRLSANLGLPKVYTENSFGDSKRYLDAHKDVFRQIVIDAGGSIDANDIATIDTSIPIDERSPDVNSAVHTYNTLVRNRQNMIDGRRLGQQQLSANFYADYTIGGGPLKGLRFGGGVNYRGKQIIGSRASDTIVNPANPLTAIDDPKVDAYTPVYAPSAYYTTVATMGYTWKLARGREVRLDFRINNVLDDRDPIFGGGTVPRPPNGDLASPARESVANTFYYQQPRALNLTTSFKF